MDTESLKKNDLQTTIEDEKKLREELEKTDSNILISAGAGAGKTELMSRAVLNRLNKYQDLKESQVVVITFTNAAAEELRDRINIRYQAFRRNDPNFREINTDYIVISTIHSFCAGLVRQRAFDCGFGVAPIYSNSPAGNNDEIRRFIRSFIDSHSHEYRILRKYWGYNTYQVILESFREIAPKIGLDIQDASVVLKDTDEITNTFNKLADGTQTVINSIANRNSERLRKLTKRFREFLADPSRWHELISMVLLLLDTTIKEERDRISEDELEEAETEGLPELLKTLINDRTAVTVGFLKNMYKDWNDAHSDTELNNNNILFKTLQLLEKEAAADFFKEKYKVFFVDEFQNTDYLQIQILLKLCTEGKPEDLRLRDHSVFLVGDPKQSIYRFKGAEVGLYDYMRMKYFDHNDNAEFHELAMNFRSQKEIVDSVNTDYNANGKFGLKGIKTGTNYPNMISVSVPEDNAGENGIDGDTICAGVEEITFENTAVNTELVKKLLELKKKSIRLVVREKNDADGSVTVKYETRPVQWSDFLILTNFKQEAADIYKEIKKHGIPVVVAGNNDPAENRAICRLRAIIRYLKKSSPLHIAELTASFAPKADDDKKNTLFEKGSLFDPFTEDDLKNVTDIISEIDAIYREKGVTAVLYHALTQGWLTDKRICYTDLISQLPLLYQFFEGLFAQAEDHIDSAGHYMESFITKEHKRVLNPSENTDCVRVMNFHQAKGLEGNIVINLFINTLEEEKNKNETSIRSSFYQYLETNENGEPIRILPKPKVWLTLTETILETNNFAKRKYYDYFDDDQRRIVFYTENCETVRKRYVRNTRARFKEYQCLVVKNKDKSPPVSDIEKKFIEEYGPKPFSFSYEASRHYISTSPSRLEVNAENAVSKLAELTESPDAPDSEKREEKRKQGGALYGTVMHRAFELFLKAGKLGHQPTEKELADFVKQAILENNSEEGNAFDIFAPVLNNLKHFAQEFTDKYGKCETALETPLYFVFDKTKTDSTNREMLRLIKQNDPETDPDKVLFTGFSDLIVFGEKGASVIDYKSDKDKPAQEFIIKYESQQKAYILCLDSLLGGIDKNMTLYAAQKKESPWIIRCVI